MCRSVLLLELVLLVRHVGERHHVVRQGDYPIRAIATPDLHRHGQ